MTMHGAKHTKFPIQSGTFLPALNSLTSSGCQEQFLRAKFAGTQIRFTSMYYRRRAQSVCDTGCRSRRHIHISANKSKKARNWSWFWTSYTLCPSSQSSSLRWVWILSGVLCEIRQENFVWRLTHLSVCDPVSANKPSDGFSWNSVTWVLHKRKLHSKREFRANRLSVSHTLLTEEN